MGQQSDCRVIGRNTTDERPVQKACGSHRRLWKQEHFSKGQVTEELQREVLECWT